MRFAAATLTGTTIRRASDAALIKATDSVATAITHAAVGLAGDAGFTGVTGAVATGESTDVLLLTILHREEDAERIPAGVATRAVERAHASANRFICAARRAVGLAARALNAGASAVLRAGSTVLVGGTLLVTALRTGSAVFSTALAVLCSRA